MNKISLRGNWLFQLDPDNQGLSEGWYNKQFNDEVLLPGTLDERQKSYRNTNFSIEDYLTSNFSYEGKAWYQKEFTVTSELLGQNLFLFLERTKATKVWLNDKYLGDNDALATPHVYPLGKLQEGNYRITVCVDNFYWNPACGSHMLTNQTQGNWNGMIGELYIYSEPDVYLKDIQVYSDLAVKKLKVNLEIENMLRPVTALVSLLIENNSVDYYLPLDEGLNKITLEYPIISEKLWSEFEPNLHQLTIKLNVDDIKTEKTVTFGLREFKTSGHHFVINGKKILMRGKVDCCVFPLTGYPPMDVEGWLKVFKIAKSYGINLYRFHSWCPPKAAFIAADMVGMYLQPELYTFYYDYVNGTYHEFKDFQLEEGKRILKAFGNHPSFVMFAFGNEDINSEPVFREFVNTYKALDNRHLYAQGSNNDFNNPHYFAGDDYWTIMRTDKGNIRASFAHADLPLGYLQVNEPSTKTDYHDATVHSPVPVMSHEVGQYQFFPRFEEIEKYTGVMHPYNLEIFRERLREKNLLRQAEDFLKANGALAVKCYREELEAAFRTDTLAGFQLLDIQDFPGQGTALVGILDAFMDSKGLITEEAWREFCDAVVILGLFDKYVYNNNEQFEVTVKVANYGACDLDNCTISYRLLTSDGKVLSQGVTEPLTVNQGSLTEIGKLRFDLSGVNHNDCLTLELSEPKLDKKISYNIWVYQNTDVQVDYPIYKVLDQEVINKLENGEKVLLFYSGNDKNSLDPFFTPDFWNYKTFRNSCLRAELPLAPGSLGLLIKDEHPVFNSFPTDYHSDFQWFNIAMASRPLIIDELADYEPVIQTIDNIHRNHRAGILMEFKVGKGKLLVSTLDFTEIKDKIEVKHFVKALTEYVASDKFNPEYELTVDKLQKLF